MKKTRTHTFQPFFLHQDIIHRFDQFFQNISMQTPEYETFPHQTSSVTLFQSVFAFFENFTSNNRSLFPRNDPTNHIQKDFHHLPLVFLFCLRSFQPSRKSTYITFIDTLPISLILFRKLFLFANIQSISIYRNFLAKHLSYLVPFYEVFQYSRYLSPIIPISPFKCLPLYSKRQTNEHFGILLFFDPDSFPLPKPANLSSTH